MTSAEILNFAMEAAKAAREGRGIFTLDNGATVTAAIEILRPGDVDWKLGTSNIVVENVLPEQYDTEEIRMEIARQVQVIRGIDRSYRA